MNTSFGHRSAEAGPSIARRLQRTTSAEKTHFISARWDGDKRRGHTFAAIEAIGRALPDVEVTTAWGQPALKVHGKMFVCIASHKSAEPNSLVVMMAVADRDALVERSCHLLFEETLPEPPVCSRETAPHSSRRSSGPRGRRTPFRQRPDAE